MDRMTLQSRTENNRAEFRKVKNKLSEPDVTIFMRSDVGWNIRIDLPSIGKCNNKTVVLTPQWFNNCQ